MIIHDKQDITTEIGRNYWLFIIQIWGYGSLRGDEGFDMWHVTGFWNSLMKFPHSGSAFSGWIVRFFFRPYNSLTRNYKEKNQVHAESQFWYVYKLQVSAWSLLCSTLLGALGARAQGPHCDAPIARATHAETPFALQAQGLGEVASNPTERNIPLSH